MMQAMLTALTASGSIAGDAAANAMATFTQQASQTGLTQTQTPQPTQNQDLPLSDHPRPPATNIDEERL